ncbi:MAG TPA: DUF4390 domain-containing protein [Rhodocyclaceae bacterium]|nr:DUF4390 domain-containing protein [Rhodocyclaceae bacterium]
MTGFITRCWKNASLALLLVLLAAPAFAGSIEPVRGQLSLGDEGYVLSAEFAVDLGPRFEEAVSRGVPLNFSLEFTLSRRRWYWIDEHIAGHVVNYRLSYNALTRQYRVSVGGLHRSFATLEEALGMLGRVAALPVADKAAIKPGETYSVAVRLALDKSQLPKPLQVDAIASKDWQVEANVLRWQFTPTVEGK